MEIEFIKTNLKPTPEPRKLDLGKWPVCSECGQGTTGIPNVPPKCHPNASHTCLRSYVEGKLKKPFNADEWKIEETTLDLTKDIKLR